jgi:hypothetical protein
LNDGKDKVGWACIALGEKWQSLVRKPEGNRTLGRPRFRWEDNMGWGMDRIYLFKVRDE